MRHENTVGQWLCVRLRGTAAAASRGKTCRNPAQRAIENSHRFIGGYRGTESDKSRQGRQNTSFQIFFRPAGLLIAFLLVPTDKSVGYFLSPSGLGSHVRRNLWLGS